MHRQLLNLNPRKCEGSDEMHPRILTSFARYLAAPLAKFFNNSLETGIVPVDWKSSIICPIYKKVSKGDAANYRPICLTSVACKILERILKTNILQYLKEAFRVKVGDHHSGEGTVKSGVPLIFIPF